MAIVRIRFVAGPGFVGAAIRRVTGSLFEHVEFGTPEGTWIGAHDDGGIQERPADYAVYTRQYVYEIPCTEAEQDALLSWARARIGTKYDFFDILGLLMQNRTVHSPNRFICSQFCTEGLLVVFGAPRVLNTLADWAYRITPETLHLSPILVGNRVKKAE